MMRNRVFSWALAVLGLIFASFAAAQQVEATRGQLAATSSLIGTPWKGTWKSGTTAATGDLVIQVTEINGDVVKGKLLMTRPNNGVWQCKDTLTDVSGKIMGDQIVLEIDFGGRCNKNSFTFKLKDGKIDGTYQTQSGSFGTYVLEPKSDQVATANN